MRVLGCDPSTKTGLVYIDGTDVYATVMRNEHLKGIARVEWIRNAFNTYLDSHPAIDCAVIEGYAYANKFTLSTLIEIGINLRLSLYQRKIPCYICPPTTLKRYATGKGNSKKPEVAAGVLSKWGYSSPSDDVVDAFVLAKIAQDKASGSPVTGIELLT